jgi:GT2 family glycosyltransferase
MKITIGVATYGPFPRVDGFFSSLRNNLDPQFDINLVCVDDGTPQADVVRAREEKARKYRFLYVHHELNRGIPAAWNTILKEAIAAQSELAIIFNDDIRLMSPGWLTRMAKFFELNQQIGTVGIPLCNEPSFDDSKSEEMWGKQPGLVGCAVGCVFGVRPDVAMLVENPDGTHGYWEDLVSFHEELELGFRLAEKGFSSYMLPWPPAYHMGGATFGSCPELTWRDVSPYLPAEEFIAYAQSSRWYVPQYLSAYESGKFDRMMYSRAMFCKRWGILAMDRKWIDPLTKEEVDIYDEPQRYVHRLVVDQLQGREVQWMDKMGVMQKSIT